MKKTLFRYFVFIGLFVHVAVLVLLIVTPKLPSKLYSKFASFYYQKATDYEYERITGSESVNLEHEIKKAFKPWTPLEHTSESKNTVSINGVFFKDVYSALIELNDGDELRFHEGVFNTSFSIDKDDITIAGNGHVIFEKSAAKGKGFIVNRGKNLKVRNIECRHISVADKNGACIRQEGEGLTLEHVYFHRSENGVLETAKNRSNIFILDSRFELLGKSGQAHAIYSNRANLYIHNSLFIATKDEGHAIKNRGEKTHISNSLIASLSSDDSRLVDIPNGGELKIQNSILQQGPLSVNGQAIGFGLEGINSSQNSILLEGNIILLERIKHNTLLAVEDNSIAVVKNNEILSKDLESIYLANDFFSSRKEMLMPTYPYFPFNTCELLDACPVLLPE